ncbi:YdcF family protein [Spirosoma flavum]|uniref:YdcF family protein n=1 Tax=Spirosoma flavum TaxID=2048557 RepID=A0ABW6ADV3_9BACT
MKIILVLGSPNSSNGELSAMAFSRLQVCRQLYSAGLTKIVLTGGFGTHFNTTSKPHAHYLQQALLTSGVTTADVLALIESGNSVEDAKLSRWIIDLYKPDEIIIVTSDYHQARAKLIFETVYAPFTNITFAVASSEFIDPSIINPLKRHEEIALQDLVDHGVR